ncbi:MerR family transcriptional regulator [Dactylosporangium sp. CA-152071]|uniref:MerR family transcriptional regulator n=1 Tax=Dactylosporangium sp. CA-152071 TaxID=3239933 RepID=UPI003D8B1D50
MATVGGTALNRVSLIDRSDAASISVTRVDVLAGAGRMRISDLSRQSEVPVATVKFYLREGLLPPGMSTARNQAKYDDSHLGRLRLIRILTTVGRLSLSSVREVLAAVDAKGLSLQGQCVAINRALMLEQAGAVPPDVPVAEVERVRGLLHGLGWVIAADAPGVGMLAQVLEALQRLGWTADVQAFVPYAQVVEQVVEHERQLVPDFPAASAVACSVLFEVALVALRGLAQEHMFADLDTSA